MNILVYTWTNGFQYEVVNVFARELSEGLKDLGCNVSIIDVNDQETNVFKETIDHISDGLDLVINFNGFIVDDVMSSLYECFNKCNVVVTTIFVDHPFHHLDRIQKHSKRNHIICLYDKGFLNSFESYISKDYPLAQLMHGGSTLSNSNKEEKEHDIIIAGSISKHIDIFSYAKSIKDKSISDFVIRLYERAKNDYSKTLDKHLKDNLIEFNLNEDIVFGNFNIKKIISNIFSVVDKALRQEMRVTAIKSVLDLGVPVRLFGNCHINDFDEYKNLTINGPIGYTDLINEIRKSKIIIHDLNVCASGSHERVFTAMLGETLVISNENNFADESFVDGDSIVFYNVNDPTSLSKEVDFYLKKTIERKSITDKALSLVTQNHTWNNRAKELLEIYNQFKRHLYRRQ